MTNKLNGFTKYVMAIIFIAGLLIGYGILQGKVAANTKDVERHETYINDVKSDVSDIKSGVARIEIKLGITK